MSESDVFDSVVINGKTDRQGINVLFLGLNLMRKIIEFTNFSLSGKLLWGVCLSIIL